MTTLRSLCAIGACLMTVAAGVLPIGTDVVEAQQKERQAAASFFQGLFRQGRQPSIATTKNFAVYYLPEHFPGQSVVDNLLGLIDRWADLVGAPPQLLSGDQIPEYVVQVIGELEFAYQRLVDLGYAPPVGPRTPSSRYSSCRQTGCPPRRPRGRLIAILCLDRASS